MHSYIAADSSEGIRLTANFQRFIIIFLIASIGTLINGLCIKCFHFNIQGVTGYVLGDKHEEVYSLISLGNSLLLSVRDPKSLGIRIIQITFFFFAAIIPVASLFVLLALFCIPMTLSKQRTVFIIAEITNAWSATEVFLLSILAALWQLSEFAKFIVGDKCDLLDKILKEYFTDELGENTFCFGIDAKVGWNSIFLIAAVIKCRIITTFLLKMAHQAIKERVQREGDVEKEYNFEVTIIDKLYRLPLSRFFIIETRSMVNSDQHNITFESDGRIYEQNAQTIATFDDLIDSRNEPLINAFNNSF